jgi:hypothetical protein
MTRNQPAMVKGAPVWVKIAETETGRTVLKAGYIASTRQNRNGTVCVRIPGIKSNVHVPSSHIQMAGSA